MRVIRTAAAQLGPIQKAEGRDSVVARMIALMDEAKSQDADLIVYPELALTTFFPRWYHADRAEADPWFEREMPGPATAPLFARARQHGMAMSFGYAELTPEGRHFNTSILVDRDGAIVGKYRKVHLPGHDEFDPERTHQHLEKRYFEPGDLGFPVWRMLGGILGIQLDQFALELRVQEHGLRGCNQRRQFGKLRGSAEQLLVDVEDVDERLGGEKPEVADRLDINRRG